MDIHSECRISKYMLQIQKITGPLSLDQLESLKNLSENQEIKISTADNYRDIREMSQNSQSRRTKAQDMWMSSPRKLKINYFESGNTKMLGEHGRWSRHSDCVNGTYAVPKVNIWQERSGYKMKNKENKEVQAETNRSMNSHRQTTYTKTKDTHNDNIDAKMASVIEETLDLCKKRLLKRYAEVQKGTVIPTPTDLYTQHCEENPIYYSYDYLSSRNGETYLSEQEAHYSRIDSNGCTPYCNDDLRKSMEIHKRKMEPHSTKQNKENIVLTPPSIPSTFSYYTTVSAIPKNWTVEESDNDVLDDHYYREQLVVPRIDLEFRENPKKEKAPEGKLSHHSSYSSFWSKSETSNSVRKWFKEKGIDFNEPSSRPKQEQNITEQTVDDKKRRTFKEVNKKIQRTRENLNMDYTLDNSSSSDKSLYSNPSVRISAKTQNKRTDSWVVDTSNYIEMAKITGAEHDLFPKSEPEEEDNNMSESDSSAMSDWTSISQRNSHRSSPKLQNVESKAAVSTLAMQQMPSEEPVPGVYVQRLPLSPIEEVSDEFSEKSNQVGQVEIHREWSDISIFSREGNKAYKIGSTAVDISEVNAKSCQNGQIDNEWSDVSVFSREEKPANFQRLKECYMEECLEEEKQKQRVIRDDWSDVSVFRRKEKPANLQRLKECYMEECFEEEKQKQRVIRDDWSDVSVFSREEKPANLQRLKECYMEECFEEEKQRQEEIRDDWSDVSVFSREEKRTDLQRLKEDENQRKNEIRDEWSDISVFSRTEKKDTINRTEGKDKLKTIEEYYKEYLEEKRVKMQALKRDDWSDISVFSRGGQDSHPEMNGNSCTVDACTQQNIKEQPNQMVHANSMGYYSSGDSEVYTGVSGYVNNIVKTLESQHTHKQLGVEKVYSRETSDDDISELSFSSPGSGVVILSEFSGKASEMNHRDFEVKGCTSPHASNAGLDDSNVGTKEQNNIWPAGDQGPDDTDAESIISWSDDALPIEDSTQYEENCTEFCEKRKSGKAEEDGESKDKDSFWGSDEDEFLEKTNKEISKENASHLKKAPVYEPLKKNDNRLSVDEVSSDWNSDDSTELDYKNSEKNVNYNCKESKNKTKRDKSTVSKARVALNETDAEVKTKTLSNRSSSITSASTVGQEYTPIQTSSFKPKYDMQTLSLLACAGCSIRDLMGSTDTDFKSSSLYENRPSYSTAKTSSGTTSSLITELRPWEPLNLAGKPRTTSYTPVSDATRYSDFNRSKTSDRPGSSGIVNGPLYPRFGMASHLTPLSYGSKWSAS